MLSKAVLLSALLGCSASKNRINDLDIKPPNDLCKKVELEAGEYQGYIDGRFSTYSVNLIKSEFEAEKSCFYITPIIDLSLVTIWDYRCDNEADQVYSFLFTPSDKPIKEYSRVDFTDQEIKFYDHLLKEGQRLACPKNKLE